MNISLYFFTYKFEVYDIYNHSLDLMQPIGELIIKKYLYIY